MKKRFYSLGFTAFLLWIAIYGCAGMGSDGLAHNNSMKEIYQEKALALEKQGELQQALLAWRIAARLDPDNTLMPKIIADLIDTIHTQAKTHFDQGREHFQKNNFDQARRSFLITLRLSPEHKGALEYLKHRLPASGRKRYEVQPGDSYSKIAADHYQDYSKAYAIAYFNDQDPKKPLLVGTQLILPQLPSVYLITPSSSEKDRAKAPAAQKSSGEPSSDITKDESENTAAKDSAIFQAGMNLMAKKRYADALILFKRVSPGFNGRDQTIAKAQNLIKEQAQKQAIDAALNKAEAQIADKAYEKALVILEKVISDSPANTRARRLRDQARYAWAKELIGQEKEAQAIELLQKLDKAYQDTGELLIQVRAKLNARAEAYYRKGVKYFLNEELESAIENWKTALSLNPDHPKAGSDMENALRLLKKWHDLDKKAPDAPDNPGHDHRIP